MAVIERPCYCTREETRRAADVQLASYSDARIDRAIQSSADDVDRLLSRNFMLNDTTVAFDWPNYQYAYPWRLWLDAAELADVTVNVPVVNSGGVIIPNSAIFWGNPAYNPSTGENRYPYTYFELDRSQNYSFGNGPTPQREIKITGSFGYWRVFEPAGQLAASMGSSDSTATVNDGNTPGVGDMMLIDNERMLVTDSAFSTLSAGFSTGIVNAFPSDNTGVTTATLFKDEVIQVDSELMLVTQVGPQANTYLIKRAWGGSTIQTHSPSANIYARRLLSVTRGVKGTLATTHSNNAPITILSIPGTVKQLAVAYSIVSVTQEVSTYSAVQSSRTTGESALGHATPFAAVREQQPGAGIASLEMRALRSYGRQARTRVV
jgi:hypothetical protein